jgi:hypothetical protein
VTTVNLPAMPTVSGPRKSGFGDLTRLVLVLLLVGGVMVAVLALAAPWGFFMGGRFHAIPMWQVVGRIDSSRAGGGYAVYVWFWPDHGRLRNLGYVQGNASVCTPRGEKFYLTLGGTLEKPTGTDTNGKRISLYMFNRSVKKQFAGADRRPELELRGKWSNPDLVLDDHGSVARNFDHDAKLYATGVSRQYMEEVSPVTLHEGGKSEFDAACAAVKTR